MTKPSPFAAVRLRTTAATRFKNIDSAAAIIWKVLHIAETTFRRLNAQELLPAVYAGAGDVDAVKHAVTLPTRRLPPEPVYTSLDRISLGAPSSR